MAQVNKTQSDKMETFQTPKNKIEARNALNNRQWCLYFAVSASSFIESALILAEFTLEERKAWNESSGFDDFFDEAVPLPEK